MEVILRLIIEIDILGTFYNIGPRWISKDPIDVKQTFIHVMACCRQTTSH